MSVKKPKKNILDTTSEVPSGQRMIYGNDMPDDIKKRYKDEELTESARLEKQSKKLTKSH